MQKPSLLLRSALIAVGVLWTAAATARAACFLYVNYIRRCNIAKKYGRAGDWAVVTGASDGIGRAMALELAERGMNVCVIARTAATLEEVTQQVESKGVRGMMICFDFAAAAEAEWQSLFQQLNQIRIGVLVNNVGVSYPYVEDFAVAELTTDLRLLKVNMEAAVRLTKYIVPHFLAQRCGGIVFLSSFSALTPTPLMATYAATKGFCLSFGRSLHYELRALGIDVLTVTPNLVSSRLTQYNNTERPHTSFLMVSPEPVARHALDKLGCVPLTSGHRHHAVLEAVLMMLPLAVRTRIIQNNLQPEREKGRAIACAG